MDANEIGLGLLPLLTNLTPTYRCFSGESWCGPAQRRVPATSIIARSRLITIRTVNGSVDGFIFSPVAAIRPDGKTTIG